MTDGESLTYKILHLHLGLDKNIGKSLNMAIQAHLSTPGCSLRLNEDDMEECKMKIVQVAHDLLWHQNFGRKFFDRPANGIKGCKRIRWSSDSTE